MTSGSNSSNLISLIRFGILDKLLIELIFYPLGMLGEHLSPFFGKIHFLFCIDQGFWARYFSTIGFFRVYLERFVEAFHRLLVIRYIIKPMPKYAQSEPFFGDIAIACLKARTARG